MTDSGTRERELTHDRLAETFDAVMNPYDVRRRMDVLLQEFLGDVALGGRLVLDGGCGTGRATSALAARGANVVALDLGLRLTGYVKARYRYLPVNGSLLGLLARQLVRLVRSVNDLRAVIAEPLCEVVRQAPVGDKVVDSVHRPERRELAFSELARIGEKVDGLCRIDHRPLNVQVDEVGVRNTRFFRHTTGSQKPFPTCENIKIFHSGACGNKTIPAPTTIKIVYSQ